MITFENKDCMDALKTFPDKFFDLLIADPPYGINIGKMSFVKEGAKKNGGALAKRNDYSKTFNFDTSIPSEEYFKEIFRVSKNQIIWGGNYFTEFLKPSRGFICWDKRKEEKFSNGFADCELAWMNPELGNARVFRFLYNGCFTDCREYEKRMHPNQKPIELYEWCLRNFAKEGWKILDTHAGSASSLIACHNLGFDAWGYEIDKEFYLKAKARLDEHTAQISFIV